MFELATASLIPSSDVGAMTGRRGEGGDVGWRERGGGERLVVKI